MRAVTAGFVLSLATLLVPFYSHACQQYDAGKKMTPKELVKCDLAELQKIDGSKTAFKNSKGADLAEMIFGGKRGSDVRRFIDERLKYYFTPEELEEATTSPEEFDLLSWRPSNATFTRSGKGEAALANLADIWLYSLYFKVVPVISFRGQSFPITSSRSGIMLIAPAYMKRKWGIERISGIVHEARHSDCTGGLTQAQISKFGAKFDSDVIPNRCLHTHVACPKGHDLEGLFACDDQPWGAYSVQGIFAGLVQYINKGEGGSAEKKAIADAVAIDSFSRVLLDRDALLRGDYGLPDMSSQGLK